MKVEVLPGYHVDTKKRKEPYFPGEKLDLDDQEANRLITAGVVKEAKAGKDESSGGSGGGSGEGAPLNVPKTVELVVAAQTIEELDKLVEGETRKGVLDAIAKRRAELTPAE
jgi:hypothetical protein